MRKLKKLIYVFSAILLCSIVAFLIVIEKKDKVVMFSVEIESEESSEIIECWQNESGECFVFLPSYANLENVKIRLNGDTQFYLEGKSVTNNFSLSNFSEGVTYALSYNAWGKKHEKTFRILKSANLPTMYISTQSGNMDYIHQKKGNEETGDVKIYLENGESGSAIDIESIEGHGNSTWDDYDKKSYNLTLKNETNFLSIGASLNWILLANGDDSSNIRNKIVYDFAKNIGLDYSPDCTWVDLYLNGEYAGLYLLSERNEVHQERVNISEDNGILVSLELEERLILQNIPYFKTYSGQAFRLRYPQNVSNQTKKEIQSIFQSFENALVSEDGVDNITGKSWDEFIDIDSWAKKYLVEEIFGNVDAGYISQFFYFEKGQNIIFAGPVWDFGFSAGNDPTGLAINPNSLFVP